MTPVCHFQGWVYCGYTSLVTLWCTKENALCFFRRIARTTPVGYCKSKVKIDMAAEGCRIMTFSEKRNSKTVITILKAVSEFVCEHPYWSATILILFLSLYQLLMRGIRNAIRWTFGKMGKGMWHVSKIIFCKRKA